MYGHLWRLSLCFFLFVSNRVCGACARTWNDFVFRRLALLLVVLARGVVQDNFPRTSGALFASSRRFACPRCWLVRGIPLCLTASAARDVLEFRHLRYDGSSQESSLGLVHDDVGREAFNVLLFWKEDVGLREWLDEDYTVTPGCMPQPGLVTLTVQNSQGFPQSSPKGFGGSWVRLTMFHSLVAWNSAKRMGLAKGAFSTAALAWKHAHPHCGAHSAYAHVVEALGGVFPVTFLQVLWRHPSDFPVAA